MRILKTILPILILYSCSQASIGQETKSISDSIVKAVVSGDTNTYTFKQDRFNGLREEMPGKLIDDKIWQGGGETFITLLSIKHLSDKGYGGIYVRHWQWEQSKPELRWTFQDSISCDESDVGISDEVNVAISYDLDSLIIENIDNDPTNEIILIYTLDCAYDIRSRIRYLVVISSNGETKLLLKGWAEEPGYGTKYSDIDIKYDPAKDLYNGADNGSSPQGKIENYDDLNQVSDKTKKRIIELWEIAFNKK